jgi:hypothetical protein
VQEFRIESSSYPAEYGTGTGGHVSVITKSGANDIRGSLFYYMRDDRFDAPNFFDKRQGLPKSPLALKQFGGSFGGPLARDRAFFFGSYEGYRLDAGLNIIEAAPSALAFQRAVPAVAPLFQAFRGAAGALVLPGASANPDFDILQLRGTLNVEENALNEFKVGYNAAPTEVNGIAPGVGHIDLSKIVLNISGSVANTGIAGQGSSTGGLVRQNSASNGRGAPYDPYSVSFIDTHTQVFGNHSLKVGGEVRITYTYSNLNAFLANQLQSVQYLGDLSAPSVFNRGASGPRHTRQDYYIAYAGRMAHERPRHPELRPALRVLHSAARARQPLRGHQPDHRPHRGSGKP